MAARPSSDELLKGYVQDCLLQGQAKITIERRSHVLKQFRDFIEGQRGKHLLEVIKEDIENLKTELERSKKNIEQFLVPPDPLSRLRSSVSLLRLPS